MGLVDGALFAVVLVLPLGLLGVALLAEAVGRRRRGVRTAGEGRNPTADADGAVAGETGGRRSGLPSLDVIGLAISGLLATGLALALAWSFLTA